MGIEWTNSRFPKGISSIFRGFRAFLIHWMYFQIEVHWSLWSSLGYFEVRQTVPHRSATRLRMDFFTSPRGPHLVGRGHAQVTCLQFLERNPLQGLESVTSVTIQLSWVGDWKTKNWLPIVSGFRIGWAFIFGSCGCSSHTHPDGPKGINHHWTSSKQASSPSSRPLKAMRPQKKQRQRKCLPFQKPVLCPSTPPTSSTYLTTTSPFWVPSLHFWCRPMTPGCFGHCTASCGAISCDRTTAWHNSCITRGAMWVTTPVTLW